MYVGNTIICWLVSCKVKYLELETLLERQMWRINYCIEKKLVIGIKKKSKYISKELSENKVRRGRYLVLEPVFDRGESILLTQRSILLTFQYHMINLNMQKPQWLLYQSNTYVFNREHALLLFYMCILP